jgi:uncharacterized membrane protein
MLELTPLGTVHTAISLVALCAGVVCLLRDKAISPTTRLGKVYLWTTVLTCLTSFGIFQHGGFGKPHALAVMTLIVLGVAGLAGQTRGPRLFGHLAPYVQTISYSLTFFFHMVPGVTETFTRFPVGAPTFSSAEDPNVGMTAGLMFLVFFIGAVFQVRRLRARDSAMALGSLA